MSQNTKYVDGALYNLARKQIESIQLNGLRSRDKKELKDQKTDTGKLFESISINGVLVPITFTVAHWIEGSPLQTVTGDGRIICARDIPSIKTIPAIYKEFKTKEEFAGIAYNLNVQKASKIVEILPQIKQYLKDNETASEKEVAEQFCISVKSVYDAFKFLGNDDLEKVANNNFKVAVYLASNKPMIDKDMLKLAGKKNITIGEVQEAVKAKRKEAAEKLVNDGEKNGKDTEEAKKKLASLVTFKKDRINVFCEQLKAFQGDMVNAKKLVKYLSGEVKNWK